MAYGNEAGLVIVDIEQRVYLLNVGSPDLYGAQDPYSRVPRSPKKNPIGADCLPQDFERQPRSPSIDQVSLLYFLIQLLNNRCFYNKNQVTGHYIFLIIWLITNKLHTLVVETPHTVF